MSFNLIILAFAVVVNIIFAFIALTNNPKSKKNKIVSLLALVTSAWLIVNTLSVQTQNPELSLFFMRLSIFLAVPQILSVFFLANTMPNEEIQLKRTTISSILTVGFLVMILTLTRFSFADIKIINNIAQPIPGPGIAVFGIFALAFSISAIYSFTKNYRKSSGVSKEQIKYVMLGIAIMFSLIIVTILIPVIAFNNNTLVPFTPIYTLIFIGTTTYAIIRHRFLDIRLLVARTVSYSASIFLIVAAYVLILFGIANLVPDVEITINLIIVLSIAGVILFFSAEPLQRLIKNLTDKVFFKAGYDTEKILSQITKIMASNIELHLLSDKALELLVNKVKLTKAGFVLVKDHKIINIQSKGFDYDEITSNKWIESLLHKNKDEFVYEELEDNELREEFRKLNIAVALPLKVKDQEIGIFLIGPKASGDIYSAQDIELFEILAPQLAVALQNAQSYAEIQKFSVTLERKVEERTKELEQTQKSELEKAKEIIRLKDEFVFIATHDLRTPATAISGFVSLIKETTNDLPETVKEDIQAIEDASSRLMQLVDDLLEVARSESGTIKIEVKETDAAEIINAVIKEVQPSAEARSIKIESDISPNSNVMADPQKLQEIIENLLSNAVKYNRDSGTITIKTHLEDDNLHFTVSDTGLGIPQDKLDKVFTKFFRAHQKGTEEVPGTGLGLFVVRMLVEKMKGKIDFKSVDGEGTTFHFTLPIAK